MTTSSEPLALLGRAAELRSAGKSWDEAATQLAVGADELRRLASEHYRDYERLSRRARTELHRQAVNTALTTLISLMKSPEPGVGLLATTTFVRYDTALMRHRGKDAAARLEHDMRQLDRDGGRTVTVHAHEPRAQNVQESTEVKNQKGVDAAKKVTQSPPPGMPSATPKPATAATATTATTPTKPTPAPAPTDEAARRKQRRIDAFALGRTPLLPGNRLDQEIGRIVSDLLADDAPPG